MPRTVRLKKPSSPQLAWKPGPGAIWSATFILSAALLVTVPTAVAHQTNTAFAAQVADSSPLPLEELEEQRDTGSVLRSSLVPSTFWHWQATCP